MKATALELRTRTKDLLLRVDAGETIYISRRGRTAAMLAPVPAPGRKPTKSLADLPAFGMWADRDDLTDPVEFVRELRRSRF